MQNVVYHFRFADGQSARCAVGDDAGDSPADFPAWTALALQQCPNCPLQPDSTPHCPMALRLVPLVAIMGKLRSYEQVEVRVEMAERSVAKLTTVQRGVGALMGLLVASSACPHADFLRPMAHFHLPFASEEETIYRAASTYLLGQYFIARDGGVPDWELDGLKARYLALQTVNSAMAKRLRHAVDEDGAINGLVILDLLAKALPYSIDDKLDDIRAAFAAVR
ncbi:DUF6901 family protein [Duganella violaceipulchra]|uniref:Uncharacterized protein n=1 Tax=Duganella violaceipulchra TaxID=2849652 RepID=A0AA41HBX5_9BURK|nr:hypothetical protein [Duganella violaceicalia]MBV6321799.1 hypothetical protein [Duganella violaceicalia]MCP2007207.1 hypothetical protein [Duganella violaceicalia]